MSRGDVSLLAPCLGPALPSLALFTRPPCQTVTVQRRSSELFALMTPDTADKFLFGRRFYVVSPVKGN